MRAQNDCNKILSNIVLLHFFPGFQEKLKMDKNVIFYPKNAQKIANFLKLTIFQATDLHISS